MRILSSTYSTVRQSVLAACAARDPSEWSDAVAEAFQQLQNDGAVISWSSAHYREEGLIVQVVIPGQAAADILILPRAGKRAAGIL